jgi:hypothetical protein
MEDAAGGFFPLSLIAHWGRFVKHFIDRDASIFQDVRSLFYYKRRSFRI